MFDKRHDHLVRDIKALISAVPGGLPNFGDTPYRDSQNGQTYSQYEMDRDGFALLAMGFTGEKALKFKLAYIAEFNRYEGAFDRLRRQSTSADTERPPK
jgi:Rha family phage regulatory protein